MKRALMLFALALPAFAVDGVVLNGTTKMPQAGVAINLVQPSAEGMKPLGNTKSGADGKFKIDAVIPPGPGLLQATYQGATYNQIITPNMPTSGIEVMVYEATKKTGVAKSAEHLLLLEPSEQNIKMSETVVFSNDTQTTFYDPDKGSFQFYLPPGTAGSARIVIQAPGGMPISRPPQKTSEANFYKVDYPLKPGETRIDVTYTAPAAQKFSGKVTASVSGAHLVTPPGVTITGDGIEPQGTEPRTQANIYNLTGLDYNVLIDGFGSLTRGDEQDASQDGSQDDNGSPKVQIAPARIYSRIGWVLGLAFAILGLGGVMLYRRGEA